MRYDHAFRFLAWSIALLGCGDPAEPGEDVIPRLLMDVGHPGGIAVFDSTLTLSGIFRNLPAERTPMALNESRSTLTFVADGNRPPELIVFDTRTLEPIVQELTSQVDARSEIDSTLVSGRLGIAVLEGGDILMEGVRGGSQVVLRLSGVPYRTVAQAGPFYLRPGGLAVSGEAAFIVASRSPGGTTQLFRLNPMTLAITDSVPVQGARQVVASPDDAFLITYGPTEIRRLDPASLTVTASAPAPTSNLHARLFVSEAVDRIYVVDPGNRFDSPGPGVVFQWTDLLQPLPAIDLTTAVAPGYPNPPSLHAVATSSRGDILFVASGTAAIGPLFGRQRAALLVVDAGSAELLGRIELDEWGAWMVVAVF